MAGLLDPGETGRGLWLRGRDPRFRVLAAVAFAVAVVAADGAPALLAGVGLAVLAAVAAGLPAGRTLKRLLAVDGFVAVALLTLPFTIPGEPLVTLFGWPASRAGVAAALAILAKATAALLALLALVGTLQPAVLGQALHRLRVPETLVQLLLMTVRYLDVLEEESNRLRRAMRARGFVPGTNLHTLRTYGYLTGMLLVRGLDRAERVLAAMKCRGYDGRLPVLDSFRAGPADGAFAALAVLAVGVVAGLEGLA